MGRMKELSWVYQHYGSNAAELAVKILELQDELDQRERDLQFYRKYMRVLAKAVSDANQVLEVSLSDAERLAHGDLIGLSVPPNPSRSNP